MPLTLCSFYFSIACGGTLSGTGHLRSPYHPNVYPHNKNCEWVISQPEGYVVTLNFLSFDVEGGSCSYDFVEVNEVNQLRNKGNNIHRLSLRLQEV